MTSRRVTLGRLGGPFGVRGWLRVDCYTEEAETPLRYQPWLLCRDGVQQSVRVLEGKPQGGGLVVLLEGVTDRDQALEYKGYEIQVPRDLLPPLPPGQYYWTDLEGLNVETLEGVQLGQVQRLFSTPGNDVMVVRGERERLLPFIQGQYVHEVDIAGGRIRVDWDPEF